MGMGGLAAGSGALVGSGAFTSVSADRNVSVNVTGDNTAFLRLTPVVHKIVEADPATVYQTDDGLLTVDVTQGGADGVNPDAATWIGTEHWDDQNRGWVDEDDDNIDWINDHTYTPRAAFGVENRGTQEYELTFKYEYSGDPGGSEIRFHIYDGAAPTFGDSGNPRPREYGTLTASNDVTVPAGEGDASFALGKRIFSSIEVDTVDQDSSGDLSGNLTIRAEAAEE